MQWFQQNWQMVACIVAAVVWIGQAVGGSAFRTAFARIKVWLASMKPQAGGSAFRAFPLLIIAAVLGSHFGSQQRIEPQPDPRVP
ncbi:MAG TPA: hypothetical protein PLV61_17000, partial [Parvularculaceae bacterium]|nr:hypothetical protein [Parvularculaceae bacterium]